MSSGNTPFRQVLPNNYNAYSGETNASIPATSTLGIYGALLLICRDRFQYQSDSSIPYHWCSQAGNPHQEDLARSSITIEISGKDNTAAKEKKPIILIDRDMVQEQAGEMLRNKVGEARNTGKELKWNTTVGAFVLRCRSYDKGPAELLGNIMYEWFLFNRDAIKKHFQFRELGPITLGKEYRVPKSSNVYECPVSMRVAWEHRWSTQPKAIRLSEIRMRLYGTEDPYEKLGPISEDEKLLTQIAAASWGHNPFDE